MAGMRLRSVHAFLFAGALSAIGGRVGAGELSLYERMGGEPVVGRVVSDLIDHAASDPRTSRSFQGSNLARIKNLVAEQICDIADGGCHYSGDPMREVHAGQRVRGGEIIARVAFGSDWPVDPLDEWFALYVGVTRRAGPAAEPKYAGRLGSDPGLTRLQALRAITINAAYQLHEETRLGSLEPGKFADFIVLDRDVLTVPEADIATTRVLQTVVGGRTVYAVGGAR